MADDYKISRERLENIANRVRVMAGLTRKMTPAEIIYWLEKVKFTPIAWANSEFAFDFDFNNNASGTLIEIVKGSAKSAFSLNVLNFESTSTGELQEV